MVFWNHPWLHQAPTAGASGNLSGLYHDGPGIQPSDLQMSSYGESSKDLRSSYQRYKVLSNTFIGWLLSTYENLSSSNRVSNRTSKPPDGKVAQGISKPTVADLEYFARFIADCPRHGLEKVPPSILNCLYKIIQRRSEAHIYYSQLRDSDASSNESHAHFISVLEKIFDTLGGESWIKGHLIQRKDKAQNTKSSSISPGDPGSTPNRFFAFSSQLEDLLSPSDDEEEMDGNTWLPDQSSSSDSKPGKGRRRPSATARQSRRRFKSNFPDFSLGEDESDEMFTRFCFFDDLNMLRKHIRCIWMEWATEPSLKGLVVAATATDVAVRMAETLELQIVGHDPALTGMEAESTREAILNFDGMVRASEDWTIGLMNPYYAAMMETRTNVDVGRAVVLTGVQDLCQTSPPNPDLGTSPNEKQDLVVSSAEPHQYWTSFMARMTDEIAVSPPGHLLSGESALNQLLKSSSQLSGPAFFAENNQMRAHSQAVRKPLALGNGEVEEVSLSEECVGIRGEQPVILRERVTPKPCLIFAAQVYLDIDQITSNVVFPYQYAVDQLGKKIYMYMNWLSCQTLKRHIKSLTLTPVDLLPVMGQIPEMRDRGPYASMSLAPIGVWQEGMGDFGRLVGVRISRDVGAAFNKGIVARLHPNQDAMLSPWSWGSRAMHILAESLRFGAKAYNEGGMFIVIAHIYNALRETRPAIPIWRHMESFLAIHGNDVFNGNRPTWQQAESNSPEFFYNRWRLRMGLPVREFSKGKRSGQFTKREKSLTGRPSHGAHGCQMTNPDVHGPALTLRRPKMNSSRNMDGISKDVLAVKLTEKRMHLDAEALKLLTSHTSRNNGVDLGYVVMATKRRLDEDMAKMSRNLFAMEAYCQRVIERVINSVPQEMLNGFLEGCGFFTGGSSSSRWDIRENLPVFAALVLLLLESYHPLRSAWVQAFEAIAEEDEDAGFVLIHEEAASGSAGPGHVEEVVE